MATERIGYIVEVKEIVRITGTENKSFIKHEKPTDIESNEQYNRGSKLIEKEYEVREVPTTELKERQAYRQEVAFLDLVAVINAVNAKAN